MEFGINRISSDFFGQITGLSIQDVWAMGIMYPDRPYYHIFYKELLVTGFDHGFARSIGLPVDFSEYFMDTIGILIITALQVVGVILVSALLIIPAATADCD